jgi:sec-independent protein translocase protein TatA
MGGLTNPIHLAFIAMIALIFLGPKRLPELAKSLGSGMREFRETLSGEAHGESDPMLAAAVEAPPAPAPVPEVAPPVAPVVPPAVTPPHAPDAS